MTTSKLGLGLCILSVLVSATIIAEANGPMVSGQLEIQGTRLTVYDDGTANDADQVLDVGQQARVRTCYGSSSGGCGTPHPSDPSIAGLAVLGELRGPELPQAIPLRTYPGGAFEIPGFQQEGDYFLENIRLVNDSTGNVLGSAEPSVALLRVRQIALASATVTTLSLEDLAARGIAISQENFQAFNFAVGFYFGEEFVSIDLPVIYQGNGEIDPLGRPTVNLDGLPPEVAHAVSRWQPPSIVPFTLEIPEQDLIEYSEEPYEPITFPVFGAIVLPGNVSFLNQFFDARLIIANGAPLGSGVDLANLTATIQLPGGNVLRLARTEPPVSPGQSVPLLTETGDHVVPPDEAATATWTIEGLATGTHVLRMDASGEIIRPGRPTVPVETSAQAAVEVVDARFHLTFSHPDVVREGTEYSLFVTVANLSQVAQNGITVSISADHISGAHKEDPNDDFSRQVGTVPPGQTLTVLQPGESDTVEFRLIADVTGKVLGGSFEADSSSGGGSIQLYTGVGELGIPLSPATLRLPRFSERLAPPFTPDDEYYLAAMRFLGLAYSLAVAPAGMAPQGLPHVIRTDVEARAIDMGFAGQRTFLDDQMLETLEVLLLDWLGNREPLIEIDELRRSTEKGLLVADQLATLLRHEQGQRGLSAVGLFDHFAETTSYARKFVSVLLVPGFSAEPPDLEILRFIDGDWTRLAGYAGDPEGFRTVPYGDVIPVSEIAGGTELVPLAVVGSVESGDLFEVFLRNHSENEKAGRLVLVVPDGDTGEYRRLDYGTVVVPAHSVYAVTVGAGVSDPSAGGFVMVNTTTTGPVPGVSATLTRVPLPPFKLIGARQDYGIGGSDNTNRYGQGLSYLFNRPPDGTTGTEASNYRIQSDFDGFDVRGEPVSRASEKVGLQAFLQPSERVVNVRYSSPLSALVDPGSGEPLVAHQHLIDPTTILDTWGNELDASIPEPQIETDPMHEGGLVGGRVLRGTGEPAADAVVKLLKPRLVDTAAGFGTVLDLVSEVTTGADGAFYFDFVETTHLDRYVQPQFFLRATVPEGNDPATQPAGVEEVSSTIRQQNRLANINIAMLGRGTVTGRLIYLDTGDPVPEGRVTVSSTLFSDSKTETVEPDGSFEVIAMPVGPLTLTGRDSEGRAVYATVGLERPGDVVDVVLELPRTQPPGLGTIIGTVYRQASGDPLPPAEHASGAAVEVYSAGASLGRVETDGFGRFRFADVPEGQVTVQAADFRVSRTSVVTNVMLSADETVEVSLTIPESDTRSVSGTVYFFDPVTNSHLPVVNQPAFINGPGVFAYTDELGQYVIEGVPVQAAGAGQYQVSAIDYERKLQGATLLPPIDDVSPDVVLAQDIVLREMRGGLRGIVLDPLGRPIGGAKVVAALSGVPYFEAPTAGDGSFSFDDLPLGEWTVTAHFGDGLQPDRIGYFGTADTEIVFGGHTPFVSIQLVGSGVVNVQVKTDGGSGIQSEVYYRPTYFSESARSTVLKGSAIEAQTDPNGLLQLELPVGRYEITAYSPFHGVRSVSGSVEWPGQVKTVDLVFGTASTVTGALVNVDGVTPIPDFPVVLETATLLPQTQTTDAQGRFRFELVPEGGIQVTSSGQVGSVDRVAIATGRISGGGETLDLTVAMKAQGSVEGQVFDRVGDDLVPIPYAQYYVRESSYPNRRLPQGKGWYSADSDGRYQVAHVYAGGVTVVARDPAQTARQGSARGAISSDWQVVALPDIVMSTSVGRVEVTIRDPESGGALPDTQVTLRQQGTFSEMTVADSDGLAIYDALPLGAYSVYAFHAPTGRSGVLHYLALNEAGQVFTADLWVDQPGEVAGTLYDDPAKLFPIPGATVRLRGATAGGFLTALDTTSGQTETLGEFSFLGIPEGSFDLSAGISGSNRRASGQVAVTATAPTGLTDLVLEPVGDVVVRAFESLSSGIAEVDTSTVLLSARLQQDASYDYSLLQPTQGNPGHWYEFPDVLLERSGNISIQELSGEQRKATMSAANFVGGVPLPGSGTTVDPYQIILGPKGAVRVTVLDAGSLPVSGANVTLVSSGGGTFPSVTNAAGQVTFTAVPAGNLTASATAPLTGFGGRSTSTLVFDDDVIEMVVNLAPAVAAHGVIYQPVPGDLYSGDPSTLVPQSDAIVAITDSLNDQQMIVTGADGAYRFDVLPTGAYTVSAQSFNGESIGAVSGTLVGPDGNDNQIPPIILDGGPPQIVSITPPPGMHDVSRTAAVEIVFSEPLSPAVLPTGQPTSPYFELRGPSGLATGTWGWAYDPEGRPVVSFVPSTPYDNTAVYSITVSGGPGGVRDLSDRPLTPSGNVGSNFTTSDSIGPKVLATEPTLLRPVDPDGDLRFDFNEGLVATADQLNGDGIDDAASFFWGQDDGAGGVSWQPFPVTLFLTRSNYSLNVDPIDGLVLTGDTLARRVVIEDLEDSQGNVMQPYDAEFRVWDGTAPVIDSLPYPDGAPTGDLVPGTEYVLTPVLSGVDHLPYDPPEGDVDRVDYFFSDPTAPGGPTQPDVSTSNSPFSFSFIASYSGNGFDPRQFPVWARAVDTSTNESNTVLVELEVQPNQAPTIGSIDTTAVSPVAGTPFAGSTLQAMVGGLADPDGSQLALRLELWQVGGALIDGPISQSLQRPAGGWAELTHPVFEMHVPLDEPEGTELMVRAIATDAQGASVIFDGPAFLVADDQGLPVIESIVVRDADDGQPKSLFYIGDELYVELTVRDPETAVLGAEIAFDRSDIFASPQPANRVSGNLYRTTILRVPPDLFSDTTPVEITVTADDRGGNTGNATYTFDVAPEPDPTAPTVEWSTPWEAGQWPANYTSTVSPGVGTALLLRAQARDLSDDGSGGTIPGNIVSVTFAGPVDDGAGGVELSATPIPGNPITDTVAPGEAVYEAVWLVPDGIAEGEEIPFSVRVVDSGGLDVTSTVRMQARAYRRVYESSLTPVFDDDPMLEPTGVEVGAVFILDGAVLSLYPQSDGSVRFLDSVYLYAGGEDDGGSISVHGTRLTAPEVNSFGSPILFYPLELQIEGTLAVGDGAAIDVSRRGLLGSTGDDAMVLPGETRAGGRAGGSHGGSGWFGVAGSWNDSTRYQPSSTFDSVRAPHLPGAGGGGWGTTPGGNGGGVIRILGDEATVLLVGDVLADGGDSAVGGGAGGAIELIADRLEGNGRVSARGGDSTDSDRSGGGGGGRIAITTRELGGGADPVAQSDVSGGGNGGTFLGGAGTIYIDTIDQAGGDPSGVGEIHIINSGGVPAGPTLLPALGEGVAALVDSVERTVSVDSTTVRGDIVGENLIIEDESLNVVGDYPILSQVSTAGGVELEIDATATELADLQTLMATEVLGAHGRARYSAVVFDGVVRAAFDDDVSIGPAGDPNPVLNDPAAMSDLGGAARSIVRGEGPTVQITTTPEVGTDLPVGSSVSLSWNASDSVGLAITDESWPLTTYTRTRSSSYQPLSWAVDPDPLVLAVPPEASAGPAVYTLVVEDIVGRTVTHELSWNVLPNQPSTGSLAFADGAPTTVQAGFSTTVEVHAEDAEGIALVTLNAIGPAVLPVQNIPVSGLVADVPFVVEVLNDADGSTPIVLQATITDISGATAATDSIQITVTPDQILPVVTVELAPTAPADTYTAGEAVTITTSATDDVAVSSLSVTFDGETNATTGDPVILNWVAPPVDETTTYPLNAEATDPSGNTGSAVRTIIVEPLNNPDAPEVSIPCPMDGGLVAPDVPIGIDVEVVDDDQIESVSLLVDGAPYGTPVTVNATSYSGTLEWIPPASAQSGETFTVTVEARDYAANVGRRSVVLTVVSGTVLSGDQLLVSAHDAEDLVLAAGTFTATLNITPASLTLLNGARLTTQTLQQLVIQTPGAVMLACGSEIDASGRGYAGDATYPGATPPDSTSAAGSHLGEGGFHASYPPAGSTYGSVTRPQENGGGGQGTSYGKRGGGAVRILADTIDLQGASAIRADGTSTSGNDHPGAGGSVWITASSITGTGEIRANGGSYNGTSNYGDGGGGAIAIEYSSIDQTVLDGLSASSHSSHLWWGPGGAGTVFLKGVDATHGDLFVRNGDTYTPQLTILPSLGNGAAQAGSLGVSLETDLGETVPGYFEGHWVEIRQPDGTLKGTWRIDSINGTAITLEPGATVAEGNLWQGVYRFDSVTISDYGQVKSEDPIRTTDVTLRDGGRLDVSEPLEVATLTMGGGTNSSIMWSPITATSSVEILGPEKVYAQSITAPTLTVRSGATLSQAATGGSATVPANLTIDVDNLTIEDGGAIDASGRGYAGDATYPGATPPDSTSAAGSHLGEGGFHPSYPPAGSTYGSVTRPQENGGGGQGTSYGKRGGGAVRILADTIDLQGASAIRADGTSTSGNDHPGAGGSVWITASSITGTGEIRANGGSYNGTSNYGDGGGGAIAIEYSSIDQTVLDGLSASSHSSHLWWGPGGAGTVFLKGVDATHGDLFVRNGDTYTPQLTILPSLGNGAAQAGSLGVSLETDLGETVPGYFEGHWVEIRQPDGTLKGTWRIDSINGTAITLEPGATVAEGNLWQGVYRFDSVTISDYGQVKSEDPIRTTDVTLRDGGRLDVSEPLEVATLTMGGGTNSSIMWSPITATSSVEILGPEKVYAQSITAPTLIVRSGATLSQAATGGSATVPANLTIDVDNLTIEDGGAIDASGRGYAGDATYPGATPPDSTSAAGSHLGEGGYHPSYPPAGSTYGSVTRPQENGGGGNDTNYGKRGGGVVRIDATSIDLQGTAAIKADGVSTYSNDRPGAGGSVWITASSITGTGEIRANGGAYNGTSNYGDGGGGAIAIEYASIDQAILDGLSATSHSSHLSWGPGGAGTVLLKGSDATHGDLFVSNGDNYTPRLTILPSLGNGAAQAGSLGVSLETDLGETVPGYFEGHWVEIRQPDGTLKGTWRIDSINGTAITLEPGATVAEGDLWQGVYRFDAVTVSDYGQVKSEDPIRTTDVTLRDGGRLDVSEPVEVATLTMGGGTNSSIMWSPITATSSVEILGPEKVYAQSITAPNLTVRGGATLSQAAVGGSTTVPANLTIDVDNLTIEDGGAIDAIGRGYAGDATYPGATPPDSTSAAGSHLGEGGFHPSYPSAGSTYGSVTRPLENGAGGQGTSYGLRGGGVIRIEADSIDLQGAATISAAGTSATGSYRPGAGGSIWLTAGSITGLGSIRADGGAYSGTSPYGFGGDGGGGAIAIEYSSIDQTILDNLSAVSDASDVWWGPGGAGTVFLKGPSATHGDLFVNNGDVYTQRLTVLPSLGSGTAQAGSAGVTLETGLAEAIPAYFEGHWVEIRQPDGTLKGTWRIEAVNSSTITLESGAAVAENDLWQGVYRFDSVTLSDYGQVKSEDPIRTIDLTLANGGRLEISEPIEAETLTMGGGTNSSIMWTPITATTSIEILGPEKVYAQSITAPTLTVRSGATLSQAATGGSATVPANLTIDVDNLTIEDGGAIDAIGRGYAGDATYPGATPPDSTSAAGSHLGEGGFHPSYPSAGSTYGSVTRPLENGAGGQGTSYGLRGGGVIRIEADSIDLQGAATISAAGTSATGSYRPGAGGSIWLTAGSITGLGLIRADGGAYSGTSPYGFGGDGGGGAIAIEYSSIDQTILDNLSAVSDASDVWWGPGGAGSVLLLNDSSTYGNLIVANEDLSTPRWTVLPSLGSGVAQEGSSGSTFETGLGESIPEYFVGHWVEIRQPDGTLKGTWRIESVNGTSATLEAGATVAENDLWAGIYRFDSLLVTGNAKLRIGDLDEIGTVTVDPGATLVRANLSGPGIEPSLVLLEGRGGGYAVTGLAGAVTDPEGVVSAAAVNVTAGGSWPLTVAGDGSFPTVSVTGSAGDLFRIDATDGHSVNPRSSSTDIGVLPANSAAPAIDTGLIGFDYDGASSHVIGSAGSVSDPDYPVTVMVENATAGGSWSTTTAPDGSFDMVVVAGCGDQLNLSATDSHPMPLQATADLGLMPDLVSPVINANSVFIRAHARMFWAYGFNGAINEECSVDEAYLTDPAQPAVQSPVTVEPNGSFPDVQVPSTTIGVIPQLSVVDGGGNTVTVDLDPLPDNTGPPTIRTSHVTTSTSDGSYIIISRGECDLDGNCMAALESPDDWIFAARLENRTTPGFGDWELSLREVVDGGTGAGVGLSYFDPQTVTGAIGDEIWLVAEDGHPQWQSSEARVWTLPGISGAPSVNFGSVNLIYFGGQYRVSGESGAVTDADAPISLEAIVWRDVAGEWTEVTRESGTIASGDAFDLVLSAGAEGDLVVLSATDSTGRGNAWRIGTLPPAVAITVNIGSGAVSVSESAGSITIPVTLSEAPPIPVSVDYRTIPGTAEADVDYTSVAGTIAFGPTTTSDEIEIPITGDSEIETDEIFQVVIEDLVGIEPGTTMISDVTIFDDDGEAKTVTYSVGVDDANMLTQPIGLSISNGVATFSQPLPVGPDRGDEVLLDNGTRLFISAWIDDSHFDLVQPDGLPASDLTSGSAVSITPAFSSLEAAVDGASDADHLGTFDLVIANRNLEILCYRGTSDNIPVTIDGWITSPDHRIRIEAPSPHGQRNGTQRHTGRWDDSAYRLQPWATDCLTSTVGNITIEGLQIYGAGYQQSHIHAIRFDGVDGDVEVLETLIFFDNQVDGEDRVGISMTASEPANLTVRNSAIWDMGDGAVADQVGVLTDDALVTANIENTTIIGGAYGIRSGAGSVTSINNLVAGAATACYDGSFTAESAANLATDSTAPGEAPIGISPVSVMGSTTGRWADLHLGCLVSEQGVTITSSPGDWPDSAFDGNPETVFISDAVNPASLRLVFDQPRTLSGTAVEVSNSSTHDWMVAAADTVADLDAQTGSYRVLVPWRALDNLERAYEHIAFEQPETTSVLELNVQRLGGGDYVHINEWWIDGVNSACGQGVPLDGTSNGFDIDVDSLIRTGPWDVGADQHSDLSIFYWWSPRDWWESEGEAKVQVLLSEPVDTTVTARYRTEDGGGIAGVDYVHVEGELVFDPGEVSKIVTIPIIDDGPGDNGEEVFLRFEHAVGARILNDRWSFRSRDDSPPPDRVRLITPFISVSESDGETVIEAEVDTAPTSDLVFAVSTIDGSAHIVADFAQPWVNLVIPAGQLTGAHSLTIVDDDIAEPDEIFYLRGSWSPYEFGAPVYGVVRIIDDDLPSLVFTQAGIDVEETAGSVDLTVEVIGEIVNPIAVDVVSGVGTATIGEDFQFTPTQLQFDPIHRSRTVSIPILENAEYEPDETIVLELTGASGATVGSPASAVITILAQNPPPEPAVAFSNTDYSFIESDDPFDFNININPPLPNGSATVDVVVVGGTAIRDYDFDFSDQTVTIVSEETEAWLRVWGYADTDVEGDETIILQLTNPQGIEIGSPSTATIAIIDDEVPPTVAFSSDTYSIIEFEDEFEVSLLVDPPPEGAATVDVVVVGGTAVQGVDFEVGEPWPSAFGPTETTQWLNYWTLDDSEDEDDETIILQLTNAQGVAIGNPSTATLTIRDDDSDGPAAEFESSWAVYSEGDGIVGLWVDVSPPPTGPASVDVVLIDSYGAGPGDYTYSTQTLNFDPGSTSASALLDLIDDSELEYQESLTFELQNPQGIGLRYPFRLDVSIEDNDSAAIDPGLLSIDASGCTPVLAGAAGAVTAAVSGIELDVRVYDRNWGSSWNSPTIEIEGGEAFQIELPTLDLGGRIQVSARAVAGGATDYEYIYPGDFPPTINQGWTDFSVSPIDLTLYIDDVAAITDRLADVRLSLLNTTAVTEVPMDDPCETANPSATIAAALTDEIQLRACQGVLLELCTSVVIREGGGP